MSITGVGPTALGPAPQEITREERIDRLERRANVIRSRLVRAVSQLDTRRQHVVEIGRQAKNLAGPALLAAAGIAAVVGLAVGFSVFRKRKTLGQRLGEELQGLDLGRFVRREKSLGRRLLERTAVSLVSVVAAELGRRVTREVVSGHLALGPGRAPARALPRAAES